VLLAVLGEISHQLPQAKLKLRKLEQEITTIAVIQAENKDLLEQLGALIPTQYQKIFDNLNRIESQLIMSNQPKLNCQSLSKLIPHTIPPYIRCAVECFLHNRTQWPQSPIAIKLNGEVLDLHIQATRAMGIG